MKLKDQKIGKSFTKLGREVHLEMREGKSYLVSARDLVFDTMKYGLHVKFFILILEDVMSCEEIGSGYYILIHE